jgi:long-subunit acyl-CoA synthetase (AMP-forming)
MASMILSNGAKVNPVHIEVKLMDDPALKGSLMFEDGRTACGILLEPKQAGIEKDELVRIVWPAIEKANLLVPVRARVEKRLIVVANAKKQFARAANGTVVKGTTLKMYETEIQEAYKDAGLK